MKRNATAVWNGTIKEGSGHLTTKSTVLNETQYSFKSRFEEGVGTNPEELLAAAHAGCYTMKLDAELSEAGFNPEEIKTSVDVSLDTSAGKIAKSEITVTAKIPNITEEEFQKYAKIAETDCPVSKAFSFEVVLVSATLQ